jgi:nitrate reductase alpha subunit
LLDIAGKVFSLIVKVMLFSSNMTHCHCQSSICALRWTHPLIRKLGDLTDDNDEIVSVGFPYFNNQEHEQEIFTSTEHDSILMRNVPIKKFKLSDGSEVKVASVFDLMVANYSVDQGLGGDNVAISFDDNRRNLNKCRQ